MKHSSCIDPIDPCLNTSSSVADVDLLSRACPAQGNALEEAPKGRTGQEASAYGSHSAVCPENGVDDADG